MPYAVLYNSVEDGSDVFRNDDGELLTVTLPVEAEFETEDEAHEYLEGKMRGYYTVVEVPEER